jgi:hypothetical protein
MAQDDVFLQSRQQNTDQKNQKYDLTQKLVPFLDRHLIFPLLEFLSQEDMYPAKDLTQAKYDLLRPTNMTDYTANLWREIHDSDDVPAEFTQKRQQVLETLQKLEEDSQKVLSVLEDQEVVAALRQDKTQNLQYLKEHHGVTPTLRDRKLTVDHGRRCQRVVSVWTVSIQHWKLWCCSRSVVSFPHFGMLSIYNFNISPPTSRSTLLQHGVNSPQKSYRAIGMVQWTSSQKSKK